jgi:sugar phosphate isomerase/epimerase
MTSPLIGCNTLFAAGNPLDHSVDATLCALERVAAAGYGAVEYSHCTALPLDQAAAVGAHARRLGLLNWSCHAPFFATEGDWPDAYYASGLSQALETCAELGAQVVVVHVPLKLGLLKPDQHLDYATYRAFDRRILTHLLPRCQELGVALALENSHTRKHLAYIQSLVAELGDPLIGLCVDTGHAALGDLGAAQAVRLAGAALLTLHLQDNRGQVDDHLPPGSGIIDWPAVAAALREVGYRRTLQLELTDNAPHRRYDQAAEMAAGNAFVARLFGADS